MNALQTARFNACLSRSELSRQTGVAQKTIRQIEEGQQSSMLDATAFKLASALDVEPADLLRDLALGGNGPDREAA